MKVALISDAHLEFDRGDFKVPYCDLLILAGDIMVASDASLEGILNYEEFFNDCACKAKDVVYVLGNHEHYGSDIRHTKEFIQDTYLKDYPNIHLIENQTLDIGGYRIFGSTFWTDMKQNDPEVTWLVNQRLSDHNLIDFGESYYQGGGHFRKAKFRAADAANTNHYARAALRECLTGAERDGKKVIVVTHHIPTWMGVSPEYRADVLSYGFANTGFEDTILDSPELAYWFCGHTHDKHSYKLGTCEFYCHPRGYKVPGYKALILDI